MKSTERGAAPLALPGRVIVAASAVGAVVLMIAVRAHGRPETRVRHAVLEVAGVKAMMMGLVQEAVIGNQWQSAVGGGRVSIKVRRRRLLVAVADLADRPVL